MLIRSAYSLGLRAFTRPMSTLAKPCIILRVNAALARLGMHLHSHQTRPFHSTIQKQQSNTSPKPTTATPPPPMDNVNKIDLENFIHNFSSLGVDTKLSSIRSLRSYLATQIQKNDPKWKAGAYDALIEALAREEKDILDKDRWWKKAFRSIAWGPTILINAVIAILW